MGILIFAGLHLFPKAVKLEIGNLKKYKDVDALPNF